VSTGTVFHQRAKAPKGTKGSKAAKAPKPAKVGRSKAAALPQSPSLVDPRLQARRAEVARDEGRRRRRWIGVGVGVVALVVAAFALTQSPALDVDRVEVRGTDPAARAEVLRASGVAFGSPMVALDAPAVARRLEDVPWVERATVSRAWPGTVRISLVERRPVAVAGTGAAAVQVDRAGRAIAPAGDAELPVVAGDPVAIGERLTPTQRWVVANLAAMPGSLRGEIADASATPTGIRLTLDDGIEVRWGDSSQPTAKADAVAVLLEQADRPTIAVIDVTVPRAATVTRS
jgi:cell division protein FtsQ